MNNWLDYTNPAFVKMLAECKQLQDVLKRHIIIELKSKTSNHYVMCDTLVRTVADELRYIASCYEMPLHTKSSVNVFATMRQPSRDQFFAMLTEEEQRRVLLEKDFSTIETMKFAKDIVDNHGEEIYSFYTKVIANEILKEISIRERQQFGSMDLRDIDCATLIDIFKTFA